MNDAMTIALIKSYVKKYANNTQNGIALKPLTFTGAVNATYDGSEAVEVVIPQGGGGNKWKQVYSSGRTTVSEAVTAIEIDLGVPELGDIEEFAVYWYNSKTTLETACSGNWQFALDGITIGYYAFNNNGQNASYIDIYGNIGRGVIQTIKSSVDPVYNLVSLQQQRYLDSHELAKRDGKLKVKIPAQWAGTYSVKVFVK